MLSQIFPGLFTNQTFLNSTWIRELTDIAIIKIKMWINPWCHFLHRVHKNSKLIPYLNISSQYQSVISIRIRDSNSAALFNIVQPFAPPPLFVLNIWRKITSVEGQSLIYTKFCHQNLLLALKRRLLFLVFSFRISRFFYAKNSFLFCNFHIEPSRSQLVLPSSIKLISHQPK